MPSLGKDLAMLRKKRDLSIEDVRHMSRIPDEILDSIENDSIFDEINSNTTYIRNYVRSYARAIGVKEDEIIEALNQVQRGNYDGSLLKQDADSSEKKTQKQEPEDKTNPEEPKEELGEKPLKKPVENINKPQHVRASDWDWVQVGNRANTSSKSSRGTILLIVLIIIAVLGAGFAAYYYYYYETDQKNPGGETLEQPITPSDSLRESLIDNQDAAQPSVTTQPVENNGSLPDTLALTIYASNGKLEPVRVFTDILGKRNPYWVSQNDSIQFDFVNTIRIRAVDQYDRFKLIFNGHVIPEFYPQYYKEDIGSLELNRSVFEDHPEWLQPAD